MDAPWLLCVLAVKQTAATNAIPTTMVKLIKLVGFIMMLFVFLICYASEKRVVFQPAKTRNDFVADGHGVQFTMTSSLKNSISASFRI